METTNLTLAFRDLRKAGYFAKQSFKCCQTCGWDAVPTDQEKVVFYHAQDKTDLNKRGECYLAWSGSGEEIVTILQKRKIKAEWDGKETSRIKISVEQKGDRDGRYYNTTRATSKMG